MRHVFAALVLLALGACGPMPAGSSDTKVVVKMNNDYAESLFSVTRRILDASGAARTTGEAIFDNERISAYSSKTSGAFTMQPGEDLELTIVATSLGDAIPFSPIRFGALERGKSTAEVTYDYDLALARFRVRYRWTY